MSAQPNTRLKSRPLPANIKLAVVCGAIPKLRDWRTIHQRGGKLTTAEQVMAFAEEYIIVPDGLKAGQPLFLEPFQEAFIYGVFDNPRGVTTEAILSLARRNSKTFVIAVIVLAYLVGPIAVPFTVVASAANSRDQAALVFKMMCNIITLSPQLAAVTKIVPSGKHISGLAVHTEYYAMSAEAKTGHGQSLYVVVLDEAGQVVGPTNAYVEMLKTSQGSYDEPLFITISTQAPSDGDYLSMQIDDAIKSQPANTVVHLYTTPKDAELLDEKAWRRSNPALGIFRSITDIRTQLEKASRLPALESSARNLLLNQRISTQALWLSPDVWKRGNNPPDLEVFRQYPVSVGIDLSARNDLTAAVLAAQDAQTGRVHLLPFVYCPTEGVVERAARDRAPYDVWVAKGQMFTCGHNTIDYEQFAISLRDVLTDLDIEVATIEFDRWRINEFKSAAERVGFASFAEWHEVGQGYKDFSPRCEAFISLMLDGKIHHGGHPLLNLAASNAIAVMDPAGSTKLDKTKSSQRIDPLVAAVMAVFPVSEGGDGLFDAEAMIG
jgi:phage terminase large subunit-like protein